ARRVSFREKANQSNRRLERKTPVSRTPECGKEAGAGIETAQRGFLDRDLTNLLPPRNFFRRGKCGVCAGVAMRRPKLGWSDGVMALNDCRITPILHYSDTPLLKCFVLPTCLLAQRNAFPAA